MISSTKKRKDIFFDHFGGLEKWETLIAENGSHFGFLSVIPEIGTWEKEKKWSQFRRRDFDLFQKYG